MEKLSDKSFRVLIDFGFFLALIANQKSLAFASPQHDNLSSSCGIKPPNLSVLIINGSSAKPTEFPWHASIYKTDKEKNVKYLSCGATIIKDDLLITSAHCVFDSETRSLEDASEFVIAAGHYFRDFDYPYPQHSGVKKANVVNIFVPCNYKNLAGNDYDIAILKIEPSLIFTSNLLPICLDTTSRIRAVDSGNYGSFAQFGETESGTESSVLQSLSVPVIPDCAVADLERNVPTLRTLDKFCTGYTNGSAVCVGESGVGLVFKTQDHWYLRGIMSGAVNPSGGMLSCDAWEMVLYTEVAIHMDWIQDIISKLGNDQEIPSCTRN